MCDRGFVRALECLDDLLVVVQEVPDSFRGVHDVVEVEVERLGQEALDLALEETQRGALRLDDLAERDDLLLRAGDVAHNLHEPGLLEVVLDRVELVPDLVQDREAVVEEVVQDVVEQVARALREKARAQLGVRQAALEEPRDREQLDVGQRDEIARTEEDVELGCVQPLDCLVVEREVEDREQIVRVLVDLRPLALRENVLDVERVPAEALCEHGRNLVVGSVEMDPGKAVG